MDTIFVHIDDIEAMPTAHGDDYPSRKQVIVGAGVMPQVMQTAVGTTTGPSNSKDFDPPEGHKHPTAWEWYFVLKGKATFHVGDEVYEALPGHYLAVPPDTVHWTEVEEKLVILYQVVATD